MDSLQIVFRHMDPSPAVEARIREQVERVEQRYGRIVSGQVVVEAPHQHGRQGKLYDVTVRLTMPQKQIVVSHEGRRNHAHEDVYVAVRDAFEAVLRQMDGHVRRGRGETKTHENPQQLGKVARLFPDHGFITTDEGFEVYFHKNSVVGEKFDALAVGDDVSLVIAEGESAQGPQATTVVPKRSRSRAPSAAGG